MSLARHSRSEEHTSELQSQSNLVCRLLLEKKNSSIRTGKAGLMTTTMKPPAAGDRIARLSTASVRKVRAPEELFDWDSLGNGEAIRDEILTTYGLELDLSADTKALLSREEVSPKRQRGIRFEAVLNAGVALRIAETQDVTDTRIFFFLLKRPQPRSPLFPYTTLFR